MADGVEYCRTCFHERVNHTGFGECTVGNCECHEYIFGELRVTSATGAEKGTKDARYDLIPIPALDHLARLYGFGAKKYAEHNWRLGYDWSKSYAAAQRHMAAFWSGENIDPESGAPHVINAVFHMFALATFMQEHPELDDRFETRERLGIPQKDDVDLPTAEVIEKLVKGELDMYQVKQLLGIPEGTDLAKIQILDVHSPVYNRDDRTITIPSTVGVDYYHIANTAPFHVTKLSKGPLALPGSVSVVHIEARAKDGFSIDKNIDSEWVFHID